MIPEGRYLGRIKSSGAKVTVQVIHRDNGSFYRIWTDDGLDSNEYPLDAIELHYQIGPAEELTRRELYQRILEADENKPHLDIFERKLISEIFQLLCREERIQKEFQAMRGLRAHSLAGFKRLLETGIINLRTMEDYYVLRQVMVDSLGITEDSAYKFVVQHMPGGNKFTITVEKGD